MAVTTASDADFLGKDAKYRIVSAYGRKYVADATGEVYIFVTGSGKNVKYRVYNALADARQAFISEYKAKYGGIEALKKALLKSNFITQKQFSNNDYIAGLDNAISVQGIQNVQNYAFNNKKDFVPLNSFLASYNAGSGSGGDSTSKAGTDKDTTTALSTKLETDVEIDQYLKEIIGRGATAQEKQAFYDKINKQETTSKQKVTTVTDATGKIVDQVVVGGRLGDAERLLTAADIVKPLIGAANIDELLATGSKAAQNINDLQAYAAMMGLPKSSGYYLTAAQNMLTPDGLAAEKEKIKQQAALMFKPLTSHIQAGGTVKDVIDTYAEYKSRILELPQLNIKDPSEDKDIFEAISGPSLMSLGDFQKKMYQDPRYGKTKAAHETAADYASTVLRAFGLMT
jgi:hypothetical protein